MSDFQTADIDELMNGPVEKEDKPEDINKIFERYDRELLSFDGYVHHSQQWPTPIRMRRCFK